MTIFLTPMILKISIENKQKAKQPSQDLCNISWLASVREVLSLFLWRGFCLARLPPVSCGCTGRWYKVGGRRLLLQSLGRSEGNELSILGHQGHETLTLGCWCRFSVLKYQDIFFLVVR